MLMFHPDSTAYVVKPEYKIEGVGEPLMKVLSSSAAVREKSVDPLVKKLEVLMFFTGAIDQGHALQRTTT